MPHNREVFSTDPTTATIPNEGVTKVLAPRTPEEREVLRYELTSFVCEGEYRRGLDRILSTYLGHLDKPEQPAVWVSGFYGSGKSHLVRVLEYLWRDVQFPDGARARGLVQLPSEIRAHLVELTGAGRREGGLWSAAGTLGAGAGDSIRLAVLGILFRAAGLPTQYEPARFVLWLKESGYYDAVSAAVATRGRELERELAHMYVSPSLAEALLEAIPGFAAGPAEVKSLLQAQYPPQTRDISDDVLLSTMDAVLRLHSSTPGKLPCTLLVFDELQQFIGEDPARSAAVQTVVESCSARFGSRLLFVGTGQAALQATPQLSKLQGRFTVRVLLSDTDVDRVVRQVVLRKKPSEEPAVRAVLTAASGEIDRHLAGTRIAPDPADAAELVADYPLLPARRRFWEHVLRAVDSGGVQGQLRTQLRTVHEAVKRVAERPLGTVVPADFIYEQQEAGMQMSGVLLRDLAQTIQGQRDGTPDGILRARLCATIFLIGKLPTDGALATGLRATATTLADLLVEDLAEGSAALRQHIPPLLDGLVDRGALMLLGDEYRLQTRESAEWEGDYRTRYARLMGDDGRIASDRATKLREAVGTLLDPKKMTLTQGLAKVPRKFDLHFGADAPPAATGNVPVWVRDEWGVPERAVRDDAVAAGVESPIVFVFLARRDPDGLRRALASYAAARECLEMRPAPSTPEGQEARTAMESRLATEEGRLTALVAGVVEHAHVFLGGGAEIASAGGLGGAVTAAVTAALARLFPEFDAVADAPGWGTVVKRAGEGAADALAAVGYGGGVEKYPAGQRLRAYIGGAGKKGGDVRRQFTGSPYGWPQDAVDGLLLALLSGGLLRAARNGVAQAAKGLGQGQIGVTDFYSEGIIITMAQRIAVRGLIADMKLPARPGEEAQAIPALLQRLADLATHAGGEAPLPAPPSAAAILELQATSGNEGFLAVYERRAALLRNYQEWSRAQEAIAARLPRWQTLERLLRHAAGLPAAAEVRAQVEAIRAERRLLADPDPVPPLQAALADALRDALQATRQRLLDTRGRELAALEESTEWTTLPDETWRGILRKNDLGPVPELHIGTDEALLTSLDTTPLATWESRVMTVQPRLAQSREEAAKILEPEAVPVLPRRATLKTAHEVDEYVAELRATIMAHLDAGHPVIL